MHDRDIREPLFSYIDRTNEKVRIFEELKIRSSVADVVAVTPDSLIGMEIKSDADTYTRLKTQIKDYNHFFDYNYLVIGMLHTAHAHEHIPPYWGLLVADDEGAVTVLREAQKNPRTKLSYQLKLCWKSELLNFLKTNSCPKYYGKSKDFIRKKLIEKVDSVKLKKDLCDELFERDYTFFDNDEN